MEEIINKINKHKIIPVIAIEKNKHVLPLADALIKGNLPLIEITFRTPIAAEAIKILNKKKPELLVGAGTVLTPDELLLAMDNGASFGVAPGFNPSIVAEAQKHNFPFFPGILTPSDLEQALSMNNRICKFFPAEASGGISYIKSAFAPYIHKEVKLLPTGGINLNNIKDYLSNELVMGVGGTWIARKDQINNENWQIITDNCEQANDMLQSLKGAKKI